MKDIREAIASIDQQLLNLFTERTKLVAQVSKLKQESAAEMYMPELEYQKRRLAFLQHLEPGLCLQNFLINLARDSQQSTNFYCLEEDLLSCRHFFDKGFPRQGLVLNSQTREEKVSIESADGILHLWSELEQGNVLYFGLNRFIEFCIKEFKCVYVRGEEASCSAILELEEKDGSLLKVSIRRREQNTATNLEPESTSRQLLSGESLRERVESELVGLNSLETEGIHSVVLSKSGADNTVLLNPVF